MPVKDFSVFDFDYVPDEPLLREEAEHVIDDLLRFEITGIPIHWGRAEAVPRSVAGPPQTLVGAPAVAGVSAAP